MSQVETLIRLSIARSRISITRVRRISPFPTILMLLLAGSISSVAAQGQLRVGYAVLSPSTGNGIPTGSALFSYTNTNGILVSEAGVAASPAIRSGRIFVDEFETRTTIALANSSGQVADVVMILRDSSGAEIGRSPLMLGSGQHTARYISQIFPNRPANLIGSLTFESDQPLAAITLRESRNSQDEPLYTTLPVADLNSPAGNQPIVFPHIAAGEGYTTQLLLINTSSQLVRGRVRLTASDGQPLLLRLQGNTVGEFPYEIAGNGTLRVELEGLSALATGYATILPDAGASTPAGGMIFRFKPGDRLVTEAGVGAIPSTTASRIFVDYIGTQTGVAVANASDLQADVTFSLMDRFGNVEATTTRSLAARRHVATFVHELFPTVADGFSGLMEIRSINAIVPITLKLSTNTRNDLILTTLPAADLAMTTTAASLLFPHVALGGGFDTRLILLNPSMTAAANARLDFYRSDGSLDIQSDVQVAQGGGRRIYPGNMATAASVSLIDPASNQPSNELVINEGSVAGLRLRIVDTSGARRDDFDATIISLDTEVAAVTPSRAVQGRASGFSTLTITVAGVITSVTATVVKVDSGAAGFEVNGIVQDSARRLYLASGQDHSVLLTQDLRQAPQTYAGTRGNAGLKDDVRLQSLFNRPAFLAMNHADGSLYVSDGANNVIRHVMPGAVGRVETLNAAATFSDPQGIALDGRGNLWVADSGSHTIRRINLVTGAVQIVAGEAGAPGFEDGRGAQARFRSPAGIAIENETAAQELARLRRNEPPPPVSVIVADAGNGLVRRVKDTGEVETIRSVQPVSPVLHASQSVAADSPAIFSAPRAIAIDDSGAIYVSEPGLNQVRAILPNGAIVPAAQPGTFAGPRGISAGQNGRIVVAGSDRTRELAYGEPRITSITPNEVSSQGGARVTIRGKNFAPGTLVVAAGVVIANATITDTQTITLTVPPLPSGRGIVTVQNRGGISQTSIQVAAVAVNDLPAGYITTVAGGSTFVGEGAIATAASITPNAVGVDSNGNVFVADDVNRRVFRIDSRTGTIATIAGPGLSTGDGDNGPAIAATLSSPDVLAFDPSNNLLIADFRIRKVDAKSGIITTPVGGGFGFCGDGENASGACFNYITGLSVDGDGNLFIADRYNHRVRRVDARTNIITTVAGNGRAGFSGDGGQATSASLNEPFGVVVDKARQILYIADRENHRVRKLDLNTNRIETAAGGGIPLNGNGDNGAATSARLILPARLALDSSGNLFIPDGERIRRVDVSTGIIATVAGGGSETAGIGDGGPATAAYLDNPWDVAVDGAGNIFIVDRDKLRVRKVDAVTQIITSIAGNGFETQINDNAPATSATLQEPNGVAVDAAGNLYITDLSAGRIRKVDVSTKIITTVAGGARPAQGVGDGGPATSASLGSPTGRVALDASGNIYIADRYQYRVRKVDARTGIITTVAGGSRLDSSGDGGLAINAGVLPDDLALDRNGNLFIAEGESGRVRRVDLTTGIITSLASGLGTHIRLAVDSAGNVFIADPGNKRIRRFDAASSAITTILEGVEAIAVEVDAVENLYFIDFEYPVGVRRVSASTRAITTVAGRGDAKELGDNAPATAAFLYYPRSISIDSAGTLFIADTYNLRVRAVRGPLP